MVSYFLAIYYYVSQFSPSTQNDRMVCRNINCINALSFNQITDEELASDLNNNKLNINTNLQGKRNEVLDTDVFNYYNMDDNTDDKFDHTFFRASILILMSHTNESLYFSENDFNKKFK